MERNETAKKCHRNGSEDEREDEGFIEMASNYIDDPSLVVDEILKQLNAEKVIQIGDSVEKFNANELNGHLKLKEVKITLLKTATQSPRVGLPFNSKEESLRQQFVMKDYRFHADPIKTNKDRHSIFLALIEQGTEKNLAAEIVGLRGAECVKYIFNYLRGHGRNPSNYLNQKLSRLDHCEMIGSLYQHESLL